MNCVLDDHECIKCGECDRCDIDENKSCDNCCACLEDQTGDMHTIMIRKDQIEPDKSQYIYHRKPLQKE